MPYIWSELRRDGPMTIIGVMVEPGRTAEVPIRTSLVGTPVMDDILTAMFDKHAQTQDQLKEFT